MKETIYTIPLNDAFHAEDECPFCRLERDAEQHALEFILGKQSSYMEDDIRMETDRMGFCKTHMKMVFDQNNKLGLALVLKTHIDRTNKEIEKRMKMPPKKASFFKKETSNPLTDYIDELNKSCFICDRINNTFERYLHTVVATWKSDAAFRELYAKGKGFCTEHYGDLLKEGAKYLNQKELDEFTEITGKLYLDNMKRLAEELDWFADKFDYRFKDAPWKLSLIHI